MNCRFTDLKHKEVISANDGTRIGFVDDVIVDTKTACVVSIVIFGGYSIFGLFGSCEDYVIPWEKIELIGEDIIIISCNTPKPQKRAKNRRFSDKFQKS
ncbi:MAG: YlmC/YmxH family sporulation protein [Ruminococcus sp.]|nr:YlmC/YmxH family sporulation protein [Ruminococcus sp.]